MHKKSQVIRMSRKRVFFRMITNGIDIVKSETKKAAPGSFF